MQHTKEEKYTKTWMTCDVCTEYSGTIKQCYGGCEKDICSQCGVLLYADPFYGDEYDASIVIVCKECNEALQPYADKAAEIRKECNEALQPYADKAAEIRKEAEENLDSLRELWFRKRELWFRKDRALDTP